MGEIAGMDANVNRNVDNRFVVDETKKREDLEEVSLDVERVEQVKQKEIDERRLREHEEQRMRNQELRERGIGNKVDDMV